MKLLHILLSFFFLCPPFFHLFASLTRLSGESWKAENCFRLVVGCYPLVSILITEERRSRELGRKQEGRMSEWVCLREKNGRAAATAAGAGEGEGRTKPMSGAGWLARWLTVTVSSFLLTLLRISLFSFLLFLPERNDESNVMPTFARIHKLLLHEREPLPFHFWRKRPVLTPIPFWFLHKKNGIRAFKNLNQWFWI